MSKVSKSSDVFSVLNDYLSKGDDSISFLSEIETPLNEAEVEIESENDLKIVNDVKKDVVHDLNNIVDLSKIDYNFIPTAKNTAKKTAKKTTTRKRSVRNQSRSLSTNEDLSVVDVLPPKRTRLKKAEVCYKPSSDDDITLDEENIVPKTRSGKLRAPLKKAPKPKAKPTKKAKITTAGHLSLEEALALAFEPLEEIQLPILPTPPRAKRGRASKSKNSAITTAVDLTSVSTPTHWASTTRPVSPDVDLTGGATPPHSSSPMFQPCKKYIEPSKNVDGISDSFDIDLVNIKLKLDDKIETHTIRQHQKFLDIFKAVADLHKISISDVLIYNDSKRVHYDDTPHSISYRASIFLTCRIMEQSETVDNIEIFRRCKNENEIEIKVQSDKWSRPLKIKISKVEKFKVALDILAESVDFKVEQMKLIFDGDTIDINDTPMELEFEGGEIVDCRIIE